MRDEEEKAKANNDPVPDEEFLLMRTLRDMNLSKLVTQDIKLFEDLLKDIFSNQKTVAEKEDGVIEKKIKEIVEKKLLISHPPWLLKVV